MTEYFSFNEPPEWGKKLGKWLNSLWQEIKWSFHGFDAADFFLILLLVAMVVGGFILVKDITSEKLPVGDVYTGIIVGHTITGENRDSKTVTGINTEGEATVYVIPGESEKRMIAVDIGVSVVEFDTTTTEYFRTFLGMDIVIQMYSTPMGLVKGWRIIEYGEIN